MNISLRFAELLLPVVDRLMNLITLGAWERLRGNAVPALKRTNKQL